MNGNEIVLYITLGFMLICFVAWLWISIKKRRVLEDEIEQQKNGDDGAPDEEASAADTPDKKQDDK